VATYVGGGGGARRRSGAHSWHHMLHDVFVEAPKELRHSAEVRREIRRLRHRRGLR
jgi:hypothetical protein